MPGRKRARHSARLSGGDPDDDNVDQLKVLSRIQASVESLSQKIASIAQAQQSDRDVVATQWQPLLIRIADGLGEVHRKVHDAEEVAQERHDVLQNRIITENNKLRARIKYQRLHFEAFLRKMPAMLREDARPPLFPHFRMLPPEIRTLIWGFAIPRRILVVNDLPKRVDGYEWYEYHFRRRLSPPVVAQVCQESRAVARRTGRLVRIENGKTLWDIYPFDCWSRMDSAKPEWSWFDQSRDSLFLDVNDLGLEFRDSLKDILQITQCLTINMPVMAVTNFDMSLFNPKTFPRLRIIDWVEKEHEVAEGSNLDLELAIFGVDQHEPISIDVDETKAHRSLLRKLRRNGFMGRIRESVMGLRADDVGSWPTLLRKLQDKWLGSQMIWSPIVGPEAPVYETWWDYNQEQMLNGPCSEWTRAALARMPTFRRVRLVRMSHWEREYGFRWNDPVLALRG